MTSPSERLLTVSEVSASLGVSPYTIRKWIRQGQINAFNMNLNGKLPVYRIKEDQIDRIKGKMEINNNDPEEGQQAGDEVS